ncbi:MAG: hypothetical protein NVS4B11_04530 [Ktedonobacteraceae bacterium]
MLFEDKDREIEQHREYQRNWYHQNREKILKRRKQRRLDTREWLRKYKSNLFCVECGEKHPVCLQFHHRDRKTKKFAIGNMAGRDDVSLKRLMNEIEKCEVLCVNCHAKRHWNEANVFDDQEE